MVLIESNMAGSTFEVTQCTSYRGTSLTKKRPPPWDHRRALGIGLLQGPRGLRFLMSEVSLQHLYHDRGLAAKQGRNVSPFARGETPSLRAQLSWLAQRR